MQSMEAKSGRPGKESSEALYRMTVLARTKKFIEPRKQTQELQVQRREDWLKDAQTRVFILPAQFCLHVEGTKPQHTGKVVLNEGDETPTDVRTDALHTM